MQFCHFLQAASDIANPNDGEASKVVAACASIFLTISSSNPCLLIVGLGSLRAPFAPIFFFHRVDPTSDIMADDTTISEPSIAFNIKASNDAKFTLTLPVSTPVSELKNVLSGSDYADTPADRQRLIYSGRVLKDHETLATYNIKDGHTIHLVKSAASNQRNTSATQSSSASSGSANNPSTSNVPTNIAAGTGNNPLAGLTGARYAGFAQLPGAGLFGPDGGVSLYYSIVITPLALGPSGPSIYLVVNFLLCIGLPRAWLFLSCASVFFFTSLSLFIRGQEDTEPRRPIAVLLKLTYMSPNEIHINCSSDGASSRH